MGLLKSTGNKKVNLDFKKSNENSGDKNNEPKQQEESKSLSTK